MNRQEFIRQVQEQSGKPLEAVTALVDRLIAQKVFAPENAGEAVVLNVVDLLEAESAPKTSKRGRKKGANSEESSALDRIVPANGQIAVSQSNQVSRRASEEVAPLTASSLDTETVHAAYATKIAEPLKEVAAMNQRLRAGFQGAAQHLVEEQQQIVDEFYQAISRPLDSPVEVNHFLSQVPEDLVRFFN